MKRRLKALLLAAGLTVCAVSPFAAEQVTEAASEQAAVSQDAAQAGDGSSYAQYYDQLKASVVSMLEDLSAMPDETLQDLVENGEEAQAHIAANWMSVKEELGVFTGANEQTVEENGNVITIVTDAAYDNVPENSKVTVTIDYDLRKGTAPIPEWEIKYPMGKLIGEAGLNTLLGLGTVFIVLIFLSFVIGNIHWIPDLLDKNKKKNVPAASAPAPVAAAPAPAVVEEEDLTDDTELVAVIAAAIAASEQVPADGFVVRSIRKANRNKWLGA